MSSFLSSLPSFIALVQLLSALPGRLRMSTTGANFATMVSTGGSAIKMPNTAVNELNTKVRLRRLDPASWGVLSYTLSEKNKEDHISRVTSFLSRQRYNLFFFSRISLQETKIESFMKMINAKGSGLTRIKLRSLLKRRSLKKDRYCVYDVIPVVSFISSL